MRAPASSREAAGALPLELYAATDDGRLLRRDPVAALAEWYEVAPVPAGTAAPALCDAGVFAVTPHDDTLHHPSATEPDAPWRVLGDAGGAVALTTMNSRLPAVTAHSRLRTRLPAAPGTGPAGFTDCASPGPSGGCDALAARSGTLYAASGGGPLRMRRQPAIRPVRPLLRTTVRRPAPYSYRGVAQRGWEEVDVGAVKSKRMPRAVREQQMMDAAVQTFGQRGYRAASMDEIAELAGVSKPLVYLYLNSKEELFTACIRREAKALVDAVRAGAEPGLPADRQLWAGLRAFFTHTAEHPDGWAVLHRQARTHGEPFASEVTVMRDDIVAFVTGLIGAAAREAHHDPALPDRDVSGLAQALVGAAESLAGWANETPGVSAKEAAATLMNFSWAGLENLMNGRPWQAPTPSAGRARRLSSR